ncbi:hypothetical protein TWF718_002968 [Orbilia javanica]|uniref:Uncharacterized protein n=1 Tax=Orbilia javanica TaxID=47235 RepID=A0AAN8R870_9PEZI
MFETNLSRGAERVLKVSALQRDPFAKAKIRQPGPGEFTPNRTSKTFDLGTEFLHERGNPSTVIQP